MPLSGHADERADMVTECKAVVVRMDVLLLREEATLVATRDARRQGFVVAYAALRSCWSEE